MYITIHIYISFKNQPLIRSFGILVLHGFLHLIDYNQKTKPRQPYLTHMHVRTHTHTTSLMMKQTTLAPHMLSVKLMLILTESLAGIACPRNLTIFAHCWWTKKSWSQSKCNKYQNMRQMSGRALKYQLPLLFICVIVLFCFLCLLVCLKIYIYLLLYIL